LAAHAAIFLLVVVFRTNTAFLSSVFFLLGEAFTSGHTCGAALPAKSFSDHYLEMHQQHCSCKHAAFHQPDPVPVTVILHG
jgi:hypothetical protein